VSDAVVASNWMCAQCTSQQILRVGRMLGGTSQSIWECRILGGILLSTWDLLGYWESFCNQPESWSDTWRHFAVKLRGSRILGGTLQPTLQWVGYFEALCSQPVGRGLVNRLAHNHFRRVVQFLSSAEWRKTYDSVWNKRIMSATSTRVRATRISGGHDDIWQIRREDGWCSFTYGSPKAICGFAVPPRR